MKQASNLQRALSNDPVTPKMEHQHAERPKEDDKSPQSFKLKLQVDQSDFYSNKLNQHFDHFQNNQIIPQNQSG